jgi:hypothetical protein
LLLPKDSSLFGKFVTIPVCETWDLVTDPSHPSQLLTSSRAPGLKFSFTGEQVAISFGPLTSNTTLVGYRIDGQDWQFTNVTTGATHLFVNSSTTGVKISTPISPSTFELRVTNWAYGVQIGAIHLAKGEKLSKIPNYKRTIEIIGDSLSAGQYATYEGLSSYTYGLSAGLGNSEYSITAYPGICLFDKQCYGNLRGMFYQWFRTSDTSGRAIDIWGDKPEMWEFSRQPAADIVVINLGTNDNNSANNVTTAGYVAQYTMLIEGVHTVWPTAQIILAVSCPISIRCRRLTVQKVSLGRLQYCRQHLRAIKWVLY